MAEALVLAILVKIGSTLADEAVKSLVKKFKEEVAILQEAEGKLRHIASEFRVLAAFLSQVENSEYNISSEAWLKEVRMVAYEVEDIIDEYAHLVGEHHNRSYLKGIFHKTKNSISLHSIAARLREVEESLHKLSEMKPRYDISFQGESTSTIGESHQALTISSYLMNEEEPIGIEKQKEKLVALLTDGNSDHSRVAVWGMGGLGKTTLVQNVFNSREIKEQFDCYIWVSVSQKYDVDDLLRRIIKDIFVGGKVPVNTENMNRSDLIKTVRESLEGKKYLLILDDVWSRAVWINLAGAFVGSCDGSKIAITTRTEDVAALGGRYVLALDILCEKDAWELFCRRAFKNEEKRCPETLEGWARKIVAKCQGLPLALVAIGSLLSDRPKEEIKWRRFYNQFNWELSNNENATELNWVNKVINFSYNYLPSYLKSCFLYCSLFPEDYLIKRKRLMRLWVSEGFISVEGRGRQTLEELAEEYLNELIQCSMLQVVKRNSFGRVKACRMHDIVRESAVTISHKQDFSTVIDDPGASRLHQRGRRLSIHAYKDGVLSGVNLSSLRTFIVLDSPSNLNERIFFHDVSSFKYLRVLHLQGFRMSRLPDSVTELFNLHHLDLGWTWISELPTLIGRLKNLQFLNLSGTYIKKLPPGVTKLKNLRYEALPLHTDIKKLPPGVTKLKNLRYLNLPEWLEFREDLWALKDLQTLKFNARRQKSVGWIGNLTQLRCLHIFKMKAGHCAELWASIANLCFLSNLTIQLADSYKNRFIFGDMDVRLQHLQKLQLKGGIPDTVVPSLFRFFGNSLRVLTLEFSDLNEDPLLSLSHLSNLTYLRLVYAYKGHQLCFKVGWFPHLKILWLNILEKLDQLEIENGALQSLEELDLSGMDALSVVPDGIKFLTSLKEIRLYKMPHEFMERMKGEDRSKVAHVPTIEIIG